MVFKASSAFGTLREYQSELSILGALLKQTHWRRGRRSVWYERCAVVLGHIKPVDYEAIQNVLLQALADDLNGLSRFSPLLL
jgi:Fanconi-associated nuclease 1